MIDTYTTRLLGFPISGNSPDKLLRPSRLNVVNESIEHAEQ